ncbi:MAG: hypothetical protein MSS54_00730 [Clostridiales bacterium]|nr:hypothetical protein [Clostridiales bacterium]
MNSSEKKLGAPGLLRLPQLFSLGPIPSIDKDIHGFAGQKNAHAASKPLPIHKVLPAGFSLPDRFSAPAKLLAPDSFGFFE